MRVSILFSIDTLPIIAIILSRIYYFFATNRVHILSLFCNILGTRQQGSHLKILTWGKAILKVFAMGDVAELVGDDLCAGNLSFDIAM